MKRTWKSKALAALMITSAVSMSTSCSMIDDDLDDCFIDLKAEYELRLVTNENLELARTLADRPDIAEALRSHLSTVFTDGGRDLDLSFYVDAIRQHQQTESMNNASTKQVSMTLPIADYQHLALANVEGNGTVSLQDGDNERQARLSLNTGEEKVASQHTGLFTGRRTFTGMTWGTYSYRQPLYMANSAAALVLDPRTPRQNPFTKVEIYTTGFATSFNVTDSLYTYPDTDYSVRTEQVALNNTDWMAYCAVSLPSREPVYPTRSREETDEPFFRYDDCGEPVWYYDCYVTMAEGNIVRTTAGIHHPLRAGQLKVLVGWIDDDKEPGSIHFKEEELSVSTDLDWKEGLIIKW